MDFYRERERNIPACLAFTPLRTDPNPGWCTKRRPPAGHHGARAGLGGGGVPLLVPVKPGPISKFAKLSKKNKQKTP